MDKSIASLTLAFAFAAAAIAEPTISALSVTQNSSRVVTIDFTLSETAIVTLDMTTNGVSIGAQNYRLLHDAESDSMDYPANKVVRDGRHVFMWRAREDWSDHVFTNGEFAVELKAWSLSSPPDYMVVDLTTRSNRWFYASAADLPDGGIKTADPDDADAVAALDNDVYRTTKLVMRRIPAAGNKWRMGSPESETKWRNASEVLHYVTLTADYYMAIYPMTKSQARLAISRNDIAQGIVPIDNLSYVFWRGTPSASEYNWPDNGHDVDLSKAMQKFRALTGLEFDFPTEAQWEYACRAGTAGALNDGTLVYDDTPGLALGWSSKNTESRKPVGLLRPNAWGLYDMHGLVLEWCLDQFQTHPDTPQIDPVGALDNMSKRVAKGGTYRTSLVVGRSASRLSVSVTSGSDSGYGGWIGFRPWCPAVIPAPED